MKIYFKINGFDIIDGSPNVGKIIIKKNSRPANPGVFFQHTDLWRLPTFYADLEFHPQDINNVQDFLDFIEPYRRQEYTCGIEVIDYPSIHGVWLRDVKDEDILFILALMVIPTDLSQCFEKRKFNYVPKSIQNFFIDIAKKLLPLEENTEYLQQAPTIIEQAFLEVDCSVLKKEDLTYLNRFIVDEESTIKEIIFGLKFLMPQLDFATIFKNFPYEKVPQQIKVLLKEIGTKQPAISNEENADILYAAFNELANKTQLIFVEAVLLAHLHTISTLRMFNDSQLFAMLNDSTLLDKILVRLSAGSDPQLPRDKHLNLLENVFSCFYFQESDNEEFTAKIQQYFKQLLKFAQKYKLDFSRDFKAMFDNDLQMPSLSKLKNNDPEFKELFDKTFLKAASEQVQQSAVENKVASLKI